MIGRRIDALERRLGARLLHRSTRRLVLTEQGAVYLEYFRKLLDDLDHADKLIYEGRHTPAGHLLVSSPAGFGRRAVSLPAPAFVAGDPDVRGSFGFNGQGVELRGPGFANAGRRGGAR